MIEEDDPPLEQPSPMRPPPLPSDLTETEPPPDTSRTDPTPREALPDRTDEILAAVAGLNATFESVRRDLAERIEVVRREGVERDKALLQRIIDSNATIRDEQNIKLDGLALHFKTELGAVAAIAEGGFASLDTALRALEQRFAPGVERAIDASGIRGEVRTLAGKVAEQTAIINDHGEQLSKILGVGEKSYNLIQSQGAQPDDAEYDAAERATRAGDR